MRRAGIADRKKIFSWLTASDLTPSVMGPPKYPDAPIPSWEEFRKDYTASFFNSSGNRKGRNLIIIAGTTEVGTVGYDLFDGKKRRVVLEKRARNCGLPESGIQADTDEQNFGHEGIRR
ncbi:MAG: hypothetical protein WC674_04765 [Candidatus Krumholzibacteriia bacterium]